MYSHLSNAATICRGSMAKNTGPEIKVRKLLWINGFRYRLNRKDLAGSPDLVLPKYNSVIFIHGCFWHRHGCNATTLPKTRRTFWENKFNNNILRDKRNIQKLITTSWRVLVIWECYLKNNKYNSDHIFDQIKFFLHSDRKYLELDSL